MWKATHLPCRIFRSLDTKKNLRLTQKKEWNMSEMAIKDLRMEHHLNHYNHAHRTVTCDECPFTEVRFYRSRINSQRKKKVQIMWVLVIQGIGLPIYLFMGTMPNNYLSNLFKKNLSDAELQLTVLLSF